MDIHKNIKLLQKCKINSKKLMSLCFKIYDYNCDNFIDIKDLFKVIEKSSEIQYINLYFQDINIIFNCLNQKIIASEGKINTERRQSQYSYSSENDRYTSNETTLKYQEKLSLKEFSSITFKYKIPYIFIQIIMYLTGINLIRKNRPISSDSSENECNISNDQLKHSLNIQKAIKYNCTHPEEIIKAFYSLCKNPQKCVENTYITFHSIMKNFVFY